MSRDLDNFVGETDDAPVIKKSAPIAKDNCTYQRGRA
jgi:hypothetical protein